MRTQRAYNSGLAGSVTRKGNARLSGRRNNEPKPFVWTAGADLILGKVKRLTQRISDSGHYVRIGFGPCGGSGIHFSFWVRSADAQ
jgi:hypothetical protein